MTWEKRFQNRFKKDIEGSDSLCKENKKLFLEFFDKQNTKLRRINSKGCLDESNYNNLYNTITRVLIINKWFENKPIKNLTKKDIERVYDGLLSGKIKRKSTTLKDGTVKEGKPYAVTGLADSYFNKFLKGTLFRLAGKDELCKEIIVSNRPQKEVRFIEEQGFRDIEMHVYKPKHKLLFWLSWDIGENINALLNTKKRDYIREVNPDTKEPEYRINLRKEILKRLRRARGIITNHPETVKLLDQILPDIKGNDDLVFPFGYAASKKVINRAVERAKIKCIPNGEKVTWKDLRSGMACDLLKKGWSTDEVNARLGHTPSSDEIDKYVNFLAIDNHRPKKKLQEFEMSKLKDELEDLKDKDKLYSKRLKDLQDNTEKKVLDIILKLANNNPELIQEALRLKE